MEKLKLSEQKICYKTTPTDWVIIQVIQFNFDEFPLQLILIRF